MTIVQFIKRFFSRDNIVMLLMIMVSTQTLMFGTNSIHLFKTITNLCAILFAFYFIVFEKSNTNRAISKTYIISVMIFFMMASGIINGDISLEYIVRLFYFLAAIFFVRKVTFRRFVDNYEFFVIFLAVWAIATVALGYFSHNTITKMPVITNINSINYYSTGFANYPALNWNPFRLIGPFREPGVAQIFLNIALSFYIFFHDKYNWKVVAILVAAICLTYSTTGYLVLALNFGYYWFKRNQTSSKLLSTFLIIALLGVSMGAIMYTSYSFLFKRSIY